MTPWLQLHGWVKLPTEDEIQLDPKAFVDAIAHLFPEGTVFDGLTLMSPAEKAPTARANDPETSYAAAASITDLHEKHRKVWWLLWSLSETGLTSEQLVDIYTARSQTNEDWPQQTPQRIRTSLVELERAGHVYRTDAKRLTKAGNFAEVWKARRG